jgi:hypothetical protein
VVLEISRGKRRKEGREHEKPVCAGAGPRSSTARTEARDPRALRRSWAQLIKRICEVGSLVCPSCGGEMKVIAFITEYDVIDAILRHLERKEEQEARAPPS